MIEFYRQSEFNWMIFFVKDDRSLAIQQTVLNYSYIIALSNQFISEAESEGDLMSRNLNEKEKTALRHLQELSENTWHSNLNHPQNNQNGGRLPAPIDSNYFDSTELPLHPKLSSFDHKQKFHHYQNNNKSYHHHERRRLSLLKGNRNNEKLNLRPNTIQHYYNDNEQSHWASPSNNRYQRDFINNKAKPQTSINFYQSVYDRESIQSIQNQCRFEKMATMQLTKEIESFIRECKGADQSRKSSITSYSGNSVHRKSSSNVRSDGNRASFLRDAKNAQKSSDYKNTASINWKKSLRDKAQIYAKFKNSLMDSFKVHGQPVEIIKDKEQTVPSPYLANKRSIYTFKNRDRETFVTNVQGLLSRVKKYEMEDQNQENEEEEVQRFLPIQSPSRSKEALSMQEPHEPNDVNVTPKNKQFMAKERVKHQIALKEASKSCHVSKKNSIVSGNQGAVSQERKRLPRGKLWTGRPPVKFIESD